MRTIGGLLVSLALAHAGELHQAARTCDADHMRELLSRHPALNETDENGMTPLHIAIDNRQIACVRLLLDAGADPNARDRQGRTAYDAALQVTDPKDNTALVRMLWVFKPAKSSSPTEPMPYTLESSILHRQTGVTKMLLDLGADPNVIGKEGTTPLADAALKGDVDGVRLLLEHGAKPNAVSKAGTQPIHDAALGGNPDVIRELAKHSADINARTRDDAKTPLHIAAAMGRLEAVEALVELGADLKIKDSEGRTPFDVAERAGATDMAAFLKRAEQVTRH